MQKFAMVFPGQGSQKLGMLNELAGKYPSIINTFNEASSVLDLDLWEISQVDSHNNLDQTQITQPAILTASVAIWRLWNEQQCPLPDVMSGHSLGEYSALVCAGVLQFTDAVKLVSQRGLFMQEAVPPGTGSMAAIVGLENEKIAQICVDAAQGQVVSPANFNSPGQTVIAGNTEAVGRAMTACKDAGAKRTLELKVSVPSHCALMESAASRLATVLESISFQPASIPVVQNFNAQIATNSEEIKLNLLRQLCMPVLWIDCVSQLTSRGVGKIIECGPGKVLCGLIKRIDADVLTLGSEDSQSFIQAKDEVSG